MIYLDKYQKIEDQWPLCHKSVTHQSNALTTIVVNEFQWNSHLSYLLAQNKARMSFSRKFDGSPKESGLNRSSLLKMMIVYCCSGKRTKTEFAP